MKDVCLQAGFKSLFTKNIFQSHWQVTQICNFHCPYCCNATLRENGKSMSSEVMHTALEYISKLHRPLYKFSISGGEPSLWPLLPEMLKTIKKLFNTNTVVNILSNGSPTIDYMQSMFNFLDDIQLSYIITIHYSQINIQKIIEKLLHFTPSFRKKHFHLKFIVPPISDKDYINFKNNFYMLKDADIYNYSLRPIIDFKEGKIISDYSDIELDYIMQSQKNPSITFDHLYEGKHLNLDFIEGLRNNIFHYKGMKCAAGYSSIYIDEDGNVSKGQFCCKMPYDILKNNPFTDPNFINPTICPNEHCTCMPFTSLPKWLIDLYAPKWLEKL